MLKDFDAYAGNGALSDIPIFFNMPRLIFIPKLAIPGVAALNLAIFSPWDKIQSRKLRLRFLKYLARANILRVEIGTPEGHDISQFLQLEQYSKEGSISS